MKYVNNEHASQDLNVSAHSDRGTLLQRRVQILGILAIPCLLIIVGLGLGTLALPWIIFAAAVAAVSAFFLFNFLFDSYILKDNPRLRIASKSTYGSYRKSVMGLDEREKLVIDQAFRTSYRILALICYFLVICLFINMTSLHLAYRLGLAGSCCIVMGVLCLLRTIPGTVVAWHESVWVQKEETRVR
jgi:hypothetical protein